MAPDGRTRSVSPCAAGSAADGEVPAAERHGRLWDYYRALVGQGWTPDVYHYSTSFRWVGGCRRVTP